ncbi:MAG TPA: tetratricopeptide repeat protein [Caulifigura sp.]|nr:tetratricopeptide repeat protein [Caulifigura sp.]
MLAAWPQQIRLWKGLAILVLLLLVGAVVGVRTLFARWKQKRLDAIEDQALPAIETFQRGDVRSALEQFEALLKQAPHSVAIRVWKAKSLAALGRDDEALALFNEALEKDPPGWGLAFRCDYLTARGDYAAALRDITQAIAEGSRTAGNFLRRGMIHEFQGAFDKALKDYSKSMELDPRQSAGFFRRGDLRRQQGDLKGAIDDLNQAIALEPGFHSAMNIRGICWWEAREYERAVADYSAAIKAGAAESPVYSNRGYSLTVLGRLEDALKDFDQSLRKDPANVHALLGRSRVWREQGDLKRVDQDLQACLKLSPQDPQILATVGYRLLERGDIRKGFELISRAAQLAPNDAGLQNGLAWTLASHPSPEARMPAAAVSAATRACELTNWRNPAYIDSLAAALADAGHFDEAIARQSQAMEMMAAEDQGEYERRLRLYQSSQPYREEFRIKFPHERLAKRSAHPN